MKNRCRRIIPWVLVTLLFFSLPAALLAKDSKFQYSAQFICGENPNRIVRALVGVYATSVHIFNSSGKPVTLKLRVAFTFPPASLDAGAVSDQISKVLDPNEAIEVDCQEIPSSFFPEEENSGPPYQQGFLVIESDERVDVRAMYTAANEGNRVQTMAVADVPERRIRNRNRDSDDD